MNRLAPFITVSAAFLTFAACGNEDAGEPASQLLSYTAEADSPPETIFESSGLSLEASCSERSTGGSLSVAAATATDDAFLSSEFRAKHSPPEGYRFVLDDFDRAYGQYDFLGTSPEEASGTLQYSAEDGGHVTIIFTAGRSQSGGCFFSGTAITPTGADEPSQSSATSSPGTRQTTLPVANRVALGRQTSAAGSEVELHSAVLIHEDRDGPNNLLIIRTRGGHESSGDRVFAGGRDYQARASEDVSPNALTNWIVSPSSSGGEGSHLLKALRAGVKRDRPAKLDGAFLPGGGDVGNVAQFKIRAYRDPAPALYR